MYASSLQVALMNPPPPHTHTPYHPVPELSEIIKVI